MKKMSDFFPTQPRAASRVGCHLRLLATKLNANVRLQCRFHRTVNVVAKHDVFNTSRPFYEDMNFINL